MKLIVILCLLVSVGHASYGQQSFTSKQDALAWLKEIFSKHFVKTSVYKQDDKNKTSYSYEIGEKRILIIKKTEGQVSDTRYTVPYEDISETFFLQQNDYFRSSTGIGFKPRYGDSYVVSHDIEKKRFEDNTQYSTSVGFPFEMKKDDLILGSVINAINAVAGENKATVKAEKQKADAGLENDRKKATVANNQKIKGALPPYKVFTSENTLVNLYDHVEKNRPYKDRPTLLITWAHWCNICIKQIDTLLNNGLALKYNIILVNKEVSEAGFARLKDKIRLHSPDYNKDAILLFDRNSQLAALDENAAPFFLWLDNKLQIVKSFAGYAIQTKTITNMLQEIQ
ncbi:MAG TPA: hypothetical protein VK484_10905 [Ferruginibacter sp.]|nr:hypothetical protein [Ferruginibacter sp.]